MRNAISQSLSSPSMSNDNTNNNNNNNNVMNTEAMQALRSWVKESLVDSVRGERGGYYELLDAFSQTIRGERNTQQQQQQQRQSPRKKKSDTTVDSNSGLLLQENKYLDVYEIDESLVALVDALAEHATYVDFRAHEQLLECVVLETALECDLHQVDDVYYQSAQRFLVNLAAIKGGQLVQFAMKTFVKAFVSSKDLSANESVMMMKQRQQMSMQNMRATVTGQTRNSNEAARHLERQNLENRRRERAVNSVVQVLKLVPLSVKVFGHVLFDKFPHKTAQASKLSAYLDCAFRCIETEEADSLADDFLCLCVSKALEIDVEIRWEDLQSALDLSENDDEEESEEDEEDSEMLSEGRRNDDDDDEDIFELDEFNAAINDATINNGKALWENGNNNNNKKSNNNNNKGGSKNKQKNNNSMGMNNNSMETDEAAHALDEMMFLVLEHLKKRIESAQKVLSDNNNNNNNNNIGNNSILNNSNVARAAKTIERLRDALVSRAFVATLLPAPKSKFAQYIVFYLCFKDYERSSTIEDGKKNSCELLRDVLITKMLNSGEANSLRLASAAYLASFVARAKFLSADFIVETLEVICNWLARKVNEQPSKKLTEIELIAFDSCCQAVMYILCYRCDDVAQSGDECKRRLQALPLKEILYAPNLEPLQSCLPSVVQEFLKNASAAQILGFYEDLVSTFTKQSEEWKKIEDEQRDKAYVRHNISFAAKAANGMNNNKNNNQVIDRLRRRPLKMFFPFDPYVLRKSAQKLNLEESYVVWRGNEDSETESEDDDSDDNSESELALSDSEADSSDDEERSSMDGSLQGDFIRSKSSLSSGHLNRVRARSLGRSLNSKFGTSLNARPKKQQHRSFSPNDTMRRSGFLPASGKLSPPTNVPSSFSPLRGALRGDYGGGMVKVRARSPSPTNFARMSPPIPPKIPVINTTMSQNSKLSAEFNDNETKARRKRK